MGIFNLTDQEHIDQLADVYDDAKKEHANKSNKVEGKNAIDDPHSGQYDHVPNMANKIRNSRRIQ